MRLWGFCGLLRFSRPSVQVRLNLLNLLLLFLIWNQATPLFSQEEKWTQYGLRPLAMGNAFVAVADDFNALFYNPAGLARLKTWKGEFLNPAVVIGKGTQTFIGEANDLGGGGGKDTDGLLELLEERNGENQYLSFGLTPYLIFPGFGFALGTEVVASFVFHRYPSVYVNAGPRVTIPIAGAINLVDDKLSLGFGIRGHFKGGIDQEFTIAEINAFKKSSGEEDEPQLTDYFGAGYALGYDFGLLFTPMKTFEPTLGLSIIDFGGAKYTKMQMQGDAGKVPDTQQPAVNLGFSMKPWRRGPYYLMTAVDGHAVNQSYSGTKKLNLGTELGLGTLIKIGMGLHQGYLAGGFQLDVGLLTLRLVSYAEEMGATSGSTQDRRYAIQLKLLI